MVTEYTISVVVFQMNWLIYRFNLSIVSIKVLLFWTLLWRTLHSKVAQYKQQISNLYEAIAIEVHSVILSFERYETCKDYSSGMSNSSWRLAKSAATTRTAMRSPMAYSRPSRAPIGAPTHRGTCGWDS